MNRVTSVAVGMSLAIAVAGCGQPESDPLGAAGNTNGSAAASGDPLRNPQLLSATTKYGPLVVREGSFDKEAKIKPWSAYWYPFTMRDLFESVPPGNSPLEKYDAWTRKVKNENPAAAKFEEEKVFDAHAQNWEGRCNAWAIASVTRPEPKPANPVDGIEFSTADMKALLIKTYEVTGGLEYHGQPFDANRADSVFDDIFPDQFHRLLQVQLFDKGLPLIFDRDPGPEVWNFPAYKANIQIKRDDADAHVMHVLTYLTVASLYVKPDFQGTEPLTFTYTYDLMGEPQPDGNFKVRWGKWTNGSVNDHPDFVTIVPDGYQRASRNTAMKVAYVDEILGKAAASPRTDAGAPGAGGRGVFGDLLDRIIGRH